MPARTLADFPRHNLLEVGAERVSHASSGNIPDEIARDIEDFTLSRFREEFTVQFHKNQADEAVFSLIHIDTSIANAFRRILLSALPHLAIEDVYIYQNTSIIQDEVLAQRLGLIPLKGNQKGIRSLQTRRKPGQDERNPEGDGAFDFNTVRLELNVKCDWKKGWQALAKRGETDPDLLYENHNVYASQIEFKPFGVQESEWFTEENGPIESVHPNILIAKLRPGQELQITMDAVKGIGAEHAKFSPVATASYRLLPTIDILRPIVGQDAVKFQKCFPPNVIGLIDVTSKESKSSVEELRGKAGEKKAVVRDTFGDTVSRECLRYDEFKDKVKLGRQRDHFIFSIESVGQEDSDYLFLDAVAHLKQKCLRMKKCVQELREHG